MSSSYTTRPMSATVELQISEGCKSYDLYISSILRRSLFCEEKMEEFELDTATIQERISTLNSLYNENQEEYYNKIKQMEDDAEDNKMIFLGVSNDAYVFIEAGQLIIDSVNSYLESYEQGARVSRIILTNEIDEKDPPKCYPLRKPKSTRYRHTPDDKPLKSWSWEKHLCEYYVDNPRMYYLPSKVKMRIINIVDE